MTKKRQDKGRGLFLTRDSLGRHEQTPAQYVGWAQAKAIELGVHFTGTPEQINGMIAQGVSISGDLYLDFNVTGNQLSRPALNGLKAEIRRDLSVSHVFIPRRDRLARPDHAGEGLELEKELRELGIHLVFMDRLLGPMTKGHRQDVGEAISAYIDYDKSGRYRDDLAQMMIYAQLNLAKDGYSTGGRAPFGFRRHLCGPAGIIVRELTNGEVVRLKGHHVVWLPGPEAEVALIRRILTLLAEIPAQQVARILNKEGIPSPDSGRTRKDNGVTLQVSECWHSTTIVNIARNPLIRALTQYGRRSMGDRRRMTPEGPRHVEASDFRTDSKPKVILNPDSQHVLGAAHCQPLQPLEKTQKLLDIIDKRGASQRGKARSRTPHKNPLGGRVFDMNCGWLMYRVPRQDSFNYVCGLYQQAGGQKCSHNHIDGVLGTKFAMAAIQQRLLKPEMLERLEVKLRDRIAKKPRESLTEQEIGKKQIELAKVRTELTTVESNMARASTAASLRSIEKSFALLQERENSLVAELEKLKSSITVASTMEGEIETAMAAAKALPNLAEDPKNLEAIGQLFRAVNLQLYVRFEQIKLTKRVVNRLSGGILTLGDVPSPISKYCGPTDRTAVRNSIIHQHTKSAGETCLTDSNSSLVTDVEEESLGNRNRGDRI